MESTSLNQPLNFSVGLLIILSIYRSSLPSPADVPSVYEGSKVTPIGYRNPNRDPVISSPMFPRLVSQIEVTDGSSDARF